MNRILLSICLIGLGSISMQAQELGFSIGGHVPNPGAVLDIQATTKGVLIPRIDLEATTVLNGGVNPEGVIVYNTGSHLEHGFYYWSGTKWEMVAGDSYITSEITRVEQKIETEINNIIGGNTGTDISYLISFNPTTNVYTYLKPNGTGDYDKIEIDFESAVQIAETNTFIREVKEVVNPGTPEAKEAITEYRYFSENTIKDWKIANPVGNPVTDMDNSLGTKIDVLGVVNNNFKEIFENNTNTEIINEIIKNAPNNVWVEDRGAAGKFLVYLDDNKDQQEVDLTVQETQTSMFKHSVVGDGNTGAPQATEILDLSELKDGGIYYSYLGEHGKTFYINMTNDIINSIHNSKILQEEIFNTVNEFNTTGGNVYYGKINGVGDDVLYIIKNDIPEQIDISKDILKVIEETTNNTIIEKILELTEIKVITGESVKLNESIDGFNVYRGKYNATVDNFSASANYNTAFSSGFSIANLQTLLGVKILKSGQLVQNSVTEVAYAGGVLTFKFGLGSLCSTLLSGEYQVVIDYVSTEVSK